VKCQFPGTMVRKSKPHIRSHLEELQLRKLMYSVTQNDFDQVDKLIALGIPALVNMLDAITLETPLHAAVCNGLYDMANYLIERGSNVSKRDKQGRTALMRSVDKGNKAILELLLEAGGNPNDKDPGGKHVLFYGLKPTSRHLSCIEMLLQEGADINTKDENGQTMMVCAVEEGYIDITATLIQLGADVTVKNLAGESLIYIAAVRNHADLIPILVNANAPKNEVDGEGNTAIHYCALNRKIDMMKRLASFGVELTLQNKEGDTPMHLAVTDDAQEIIKFLMGRGCQFDVPNYLSLTAKNIATSNKMTPIKKLMKKQDAKIKRACSDGKIHSSEDFWKICLYQWCKENKNILIEEFFAQDINQTGILERKQFTATWETHEVPLTDNQKEEILGLHMETKGMIKYLDFLDANLYLKTAAYDGFARS